MRHSTRLAAAALLASAVSVAYAADNISIVDYWDPAGPASINIPAGERVVMRGLTEDDHLFQCCIDPWMRAMVKVGDG